MKMAPRVHPGAIVSVRYPAVGRQYRAVGLIFRAGPVEQVDWANPIAGCSGYFDRTSLASK
jgi:hypothetical protein